MPTDCYCELSNPYYPYDCINYVCGTLANLIIAKGSYIFVELGYHGHRSYYRSDNYGNSWTKVKIGSEWDGNDYDINASAVIDTNFIIGTYNGVLLSKDLGVNWTRVNPDMQLINSMAMSGTNLFGGTDNTGWNHPVNEGVLLSTNNGTTWTPLNSGLTNTRISTLAVCGNYLFAGNVNGGVWRRPLSEMIYLKLSTNSISITASEGSTANFSITSSIRWTAAIDQGWLAVSSAIGDGNATITLTAQANPTIANRMATVTVLGAGVPAQTITVTQDGGTPFLTVSANTLTIAALNNSSRTFDIASNASWTAASDQTWLAVSSTSGSGNATITLTSQANPTNVTRTSTVTVSGAGVTAQTITVTQDAGTTGISGLANDNLTFYPNPANSILYINSALGSVLVKITDLSGKLLANKWVTNSRIDISSLQNGIYIIRIECKNKIITERFVKEQGKR